MNNIADCYIYHHLGLGDHIICNGLIRYIIDKCQLKHPFLVVKKSNLANVQRMLIDKPELDFFVVNQDSDFINHYEQHKHIPLVKVGFEKCNNSAFDKSFYESVNVPFVERWQSWYIQRDSDQENKILQALNINEDYIFVHDESSTGKYNLNISSKLRQVKPTKLNCEKSIFDWIKIIENAKEVHVISSSFAHLVNSLDLTCPVFYHDIKAAHGMKFAFRQGWLSIPY